MKKTLLFAVLFIMSMSTNAQLFANLNAKSNENGGQTQNDRVSLSNTAKFAEKYGKILQIQYFDLPSVSMFAGKFSADVLLFSELGTGNKTCCVRVTFHSMITASTYYLDVDEIDNFLVFIERLNDEFLLTTPSVKTAYSYISRDNIMLRAEYETNKWKINLSGESVYDLVIMTKSKLKDFATMMQEAKNVIDAHPEYKPNTVSLSE